MPSNGHQPDPVPVPVAVIGMSCRYPASANSPEQLWDVVSQGRSGWTEVPIDRFNHEAFYHPDPEAPGVINQKGGHFIDQDLAAFDAGFFGIPSLEAETLDPQQRVVLETSWEAVENAGIPMDQLMGSDTGVFVAMFGHDFEQVTHKDPVAVSKYHNLGVARPLLANRLSYVFDLQGPSVMIDTACSGSLVAIHSACQSLRSGEASMALAGGVGLIFSPDQMALMSMTGLFNDQGRSFTFDDRGNGYGRGEGVGIVVLKRLDDAIRDRDNIRAVIRNSGMNSDGHTNGIMLPSQAAQERLARSLFRNLPFTPHDIQFVELHGTGTKAGDDVEMKTVYNVFGQSRDIDDPIFVGATKPNIGHSEAASGTAGLIKAIMAMERGEIPPNILLENFKPGLELGQGRLKVARSLTPWPATASTRKAVVNSFGFGGTNAMVVLESQADSYHGSTGLEIPVSNGDSPVVNGVADNVANGTTNGVVNGIAHSADDGYVNGKHNSNRNGVIEKTPRLFTLSAKSDYSLKRSGDDLKTYLQDHAGINLDDLSYTLNARRSKFRWRSTVVAADADDLILGLSAKDLAQQRAHNQVANVFVFTGQGAQSARMGYHLLSATENEFTRSISRSEDVLKELGAQWSLIEELSRDENSSRLGDSKYGQPASTAIQLALVDLLKSWNVLPAAVVGHSSGEIAAAYASGAISQSAAMRISYHRGFLAELSAQRATQPGKMMAAGVGEEAAARYIKKLETGNLVVACINSPSSTTISGDASAILELKGLLEADGIFNRELKVDTAYHSHFMESVSADYTAQLEGLESASPSPPIRYYSTVSGEEKLSGFGPSYWVENLVSPVRFSSALQNLCEQLGQTPLNLVEIGPHKALSGPCSQTLASMVKDRLTYTYIPTLIRGENAVKSLMNTGSSLFRSGAEVQIEAVSLLSNPVSTPKTLRNLPSYHWDHTTIHWAESRLSREHRCRKYPHHDLLGSRVIASPDSQPSWRILLSTERLPWLKDHIVDNFIVFPAAGYMTMAIQAVDQMQHDRQPDRAPTGYRLRNISFKKTLTLPRERGSVETITNLRYSESQEAWSFTISSMSEQGKWQEHCDGHISVVFETPTDATPSGQEASFDRQHQTRRLEAARQDCVKVISHEDLYARLAKAGNQFGRTFATNKEARISGTQSLNELFVPDIAAGMPGNFMQKHVVHPATLDAVIQTCLPVFQQYSHPGSVMPIFVGSLFISADMPTQPGTQLQTVCDLKDTMTHSTNFSTAAFHIKDESSEPECVLTIDDGEIRVVGESKSVTQGDKNENIFKLKWGTDSSFITADMLECVTVPLQSDEAGITQSEKVDLCSVACARYIDWAVKEMRSRQLVVKDDHRVHWWRLLEEFVNSETGQSLTQRSPETKEELSLLTARLGVEGEAIARIGPELVPLLTGQTDPLTHFLADDLLFRVYHSDEGARPNRYMAEYVKFLTFQRRDLRILEIGAGTGGTTLQVLQACSPNGEDFCSEYMYTDISSGFFEAVRTTRLADWAHLLNFQTLDLEKDAAEQGFEEYSYDLVIAANVVHATRSINRSLNTIRKLLKPGGLLGLVELTKSTPYINMTFGSIPGWWAGVEEGRTDSPLQSANQWDERLKQTGFSGVDLVAYDLPEPERHCALLVSAAVSEVVPTNGHGLPQFRLLHTSLEGTLASDFAEPLAHELSKLGIEASITDWKDVAGENTANSYVILDSAERPLLTRGSDQRFSPVMSLLSTACKVYWVSFAGNDGRISAENAMVTGLARTARNENPRLEIFTVDIQESLSHHSSQIWRDIAAFMSSTETRITEGQPSEREVMYRDGKIQIQRFVPDNKLVQALSSEQGGMHKDETVFHQPGRPLKMKVEKPGLLSSLIFVDDEANALGPDEVEIQSYAWGLNFSDVFIALGRLPATQPMVGESAGVITAVGANFTSHFKPGDRVAALFGTPYASRTRTSGHMVHSIPDELSFTNAVSIPMAFATAYYSLFDCANLQAGQTLLIHSALGGLGQAAIQIAQRLGVTIFATVGSASKRQQLATQYGIPESHIFSSRTTEFLAGVKRLTNGLGVDVVLNSLSGPMLHASWECVAAFGCFVEVGKVDISRHTQLDMKPFAKNLRFASVDLVLLSRQRPEYCQKLLQRIFADFKANLVTPLPATTMAIGDIEEAFRLMQGGKHVGKIILEASDESTVYAKTQPLRLRSDGTYIIVGGLGGLGKHLCRHLQTKGARNIALFSRQKLDAVVKQTMEKELTEVTGATVRIVTCDVGDASTVLRVAEDLKTSMPPVRGVIHGGMVLSDRTIAQITAEDFTIALKPKYEGTNNLFNAFYGHDIDFFINLSSMCGIAGTLGQSNYAAGGTYQDMFAHAQVLSGNDKVVTIDFPLIKSTYSVTDSHIQSLARQGVQLLPIQAALPVIDYAMSGNAFKDGNHQIAFGVEIQSFIDRAVQGERIPPLLSHIASNRQRHRTRNATQEREQSVEEKVALATTAEDAQSLILSAIHEKIASLTALEAEELDLDLPVANMALDSLVATEIKNWITNTLQSPVQISDILDAPSLRSLATLVTRSSGLIKSNTDTKEESNHEQPSDNKDGGTTSQTETDVSLPKYPVQPLDSTLEVFVDSVGHLGNSNELENLQKTIEDFQSPDGLGQRLQARLAKISSDQGQSDDMIDMYVRNKWLRGRDWRPRLRNFFATLPGQDVARHPQADQAAHISLAAYRYKLALDAGNIKQDFYNDEALDMATVHWLFGSNRTPKPNCDSYRRFPDSDHLVVMRRGHAFKVPLHNADGQLVGFDRLKSIFRMIVQTTPDDTNWTSILTTANRDDWAEHRAKIMAASKENHLSISAIEESLFVVSLEDAAPETAEERADVFLLDENSNRWLDKTLSFIICANGVSSIWGEHTMVDGTTFGGLIKAISPLISVNGTSVDASDLSSVAEGDFSYLPIIVDPSISEQMSHLQVEHRLNHQGYTLANLTQTSFAAAYLRQHKLPPKTVVQLTIQVAIRRLFGCNPLGAVDVISQRSFRGGRTDMIYIMTPAVQAFCAAAEDASVATAQKRRLFLEAVKSHARLVTLSMRGRGFRWHLMALREMLEPGEEAPAFYDDAVYKRTTERPVCTSFTEFGLPEMGRCQPLKGDVWVGVQVFEERQVYTMVAVLIGSANLVVNRVQYTVINGEGKSAEFVEHLKAAAGVVEQIVASTLD